VFAPKSIKKYRRSSKLGMKDVRATELTYQDQKVKGKGQQTTLAGSSSHRFQEAGHIVAVGWLINRPGDLDL